MMFEQSASSAFPFFFFWELDEKTNECSNFIIDNVVCTRTATTTNDIDQKKATKKKTVYPT